MSIEKTGREVLVEAAGEIAKAVNDASAAAKAGTPGNDRAFKGHGIGEGGAEVVATFRVFCAPQGGAQGCEVGAAKIHLRLNNAEAESLGELEVSLPPRSEPWTEERMKAQLAA